MDPNEVGGAVRDRGRKSLSATESRGTQKVQESQGAGGSWLSKAKQGFWGREGVHPEEGREKCTGYGGVESG